MIAIDLNTPPMGPGGPFPPAPGVPAPSMTDIAGTVARITEGEVPVMPPSRGSTYQLPCGMLTGDLSNPLVTEARVRELTGFDEEKLARVNMNENVANYVTELLLAGVEVIGATPPTRDDLRNLLIGDRDALVIAIRRTTYGDSVDFTIDCDACNAKSAIGIDLTTDVDMVPIANPLVRSFDVEISRGMAKVSLLTGYAQEAFSARMSKGARTQAETSTLMLAKSVTDIAGVPTYGNEDAVRALTSSDRAKLLDFVADIQPGPQLQKPVPVNCATCGKEYSIPLSLAAMFRF